MSRISNNLRVLANPGDRADYRLCDAHPAQRVRDGGPARFGPSGIDPSSDVSRLLAKLGVPENRIRVFPNATAAWAAAASGAGVAPGVAHLLSPQVRRGELRVVETPATPMEATWYATTLRRERRPSIAGSLRHFLGTPEAIKLMRSPGSGVPPSKFRPPVYVTIWS